MISWRSEMNCNNCRCIIVYVLLLFFETTKFNVYLFHFNVLMSFSYWSVISGSSSLHVRRSMQLNSHISSSIHWFTEWVITARSDEKSLSVKTKSEDSGCAESLPSYICCSLTPRLSQHAASLWITATLTGLWTQQQSVPERLRAAATMSSLHRPGREDMWSGFSS